MIEATITVNIPRHGTFKATAYQMDRAMVEYLPASVNSLRKVVNARTGLDYSDVHEVSTFLVMLASFESPY